MKHPRVYALADMFFMEHLKALAFKSFESKLQKLWATETFIDCVQEVYDMANPLNREIKHAVVQVAWENLKTLWTKKQFQDLVRENGDFAVDLVAKSISTKTSM